MIRFSPLGVRLEVMCTVYSEGRATGTGDTAKRPSLLECQFLESGVIYFCLIPDAYKGGRHLDGSSWKSVG